MSTNPGYSAGTLLAEVENLISDCDTIFGRLRVITRKDHWFEAGTTSAKGKGEEVQAWLEKDIAHPAAQIYHWLEAAVRPPRPPTPEELLAPSMTTIRGVTMAMEYVAEIRRWAKSLRAALKPAPLVAGKEKRRPCYDRDHTWLAWREAGMGLADIRDKWNEEHPHESVGEKESGRDRVKKGIEQAQKDLDAD